ncbi:MAG: hypothetical protein ACK5LT_04495 [Lachnospirales bacterium]
MINAIKEHLSFYKEIEDIDIVKLIYQNSFGFGHFLDEKNGFKRLIKDIESSTEISDVEPEKIGNEISRVHLANYKNGKKSIKNLWILLYESSFIEMDNAKENFMENIKDVSLYFNRPKLLDLGARIKEDDFKPISHSPRYKKLYNPSYRIINNGFKRYEEILNYVEKNQDNFIIAIDGSSCSGKTTLSNIMEKYFDVSVVSIDDFFLPPEVKNSEREYNINFHLERYIEEVIPFLGKEPFEYGVYNCKEKKITHNKIIEKKKIIVEGVYSCYPLISEYYNKSYFFEIDFDTQMKRWNKRSPNIPKELINEWVEKEKKYYNEILHTNNNIIFM